MLNNRFHEYCETVIATMARRIEELEDTLRWKQHQLEDLEKVNAELRIALRRPEAMADNPDPDADPFGGDGNE